MRSRRKPSGRPIAARRRGSVVLIAMICLLLASMIGTAVLKIAVARQRQARRDELRWQTDWLAEAGLERAAARWAADSDYTGEVWRIPAEELGGRDAATVRIELEPVDGVPERRRVTITAEYPIETPQRARSRKESVLDRGALQP